MCLRMLNYCIWITIHYISWDVFISSVGVRSWQWYLYLLPCLLLRGKIHPILSLHQRRLHTSPLTLLFLRYRRQVTSQHYLCYSIFFLIFFLFKLDLQLFKLTRCNAKFIQLRLGFIICTQLYDDSWRFHAYSQTHSSFKCGWEIWPSFPGGAKDLNDPSLPTLSQDSLSASDDYTFFQRGNYGRHHRSGGVLF